MTEEKENIIIMNSKSENIKRKEKTSKSCSVKCGFNSVCIVIIF